MLSLDLELIYTVRTEGPLPETKGSPHGTRQYWNVCEAELSGKRISAKLARPGGDWMQVGDDGFWRPDVRAPFVTNDGATILLHYFGLVEQNETFKHAATHDKPTDWNDQYMRMFMQFDTGAQRYRWLTQALYLARGRLKGTAHIEYEVYRVM
jgi:Protein of unknown function (DUF3237)